MTSSNGNFFRVTGHLCGQWREALVFSLICVWINGWVNNREAGDLRCYRAHYDVTVMLPNNCTFCTGGHRTRVAAVTLDNMAEDAVAASAGLWQIPTVSVRHCGSAFVSWLSVLWDTLTRNPELQWFGISPQFRLKLSRGDEGVGNVCFPGDGVSVGPDEGTVVYRWT